MKVLNFEDFMKKYNLKSDTMNESQLQKVNNSPLYPRDSKIYFQKKDLLSSILVVWAEVIGLVFI